jgi:tetratricopeptide (TPR) repeat protein
MKVPRPWLSILLMLALLPVVVACDDTAEREAKYLEKGKTSLERGDLSSAKDAFNNALKINPKSAAAYYYLGQVAKAKNDVARALSKYHRALQEDPNFLPALSESGQLFLLLGRLERVEEAVHAIYELVPQHPSGLLLEAGIHLRRRELNQAIDKSKAVLIADPSSLAASTMLALALHYKGQVDEALATLESNEAHAHENEAIYRLMAQILVENQRFDEAEAAHREFIASAPEQLAPRIDLAQLHIRQGELDEAETLLLEAVRDFPDSAETRDVVIEFLTNIRTGGHAEALLRELVQQYPDVHDYRFGLAMLYEQLGLFDRAKAVYEEIIVRADDVPVALDAKVLLAKLYLSQDAIADAFELADEVLQVDVVNREALLIRASVSSKRGKFFDAVMDLRVLLNNDPALPQGLRMLADAHRRLGEEELAIETLRSLLEIHPTNVEGRAELASVLISLGQIEAAESQIRKAQTLDPNNPLVTRAIIELLIAQQKWDEGELIARALAARQGEELTGNLLLGQLFSAQNSFKRAALAFFNILQINPDHEVALTDYVRVLMQDGQLTKAREFLENRAHDDPKDGATYNLLGQVYSAEDRSIEEIEAAFQRAAELDKSWSIPFLHLGRILISKGMPQDALEVIMEGLARDPNSEALNIAYAILHQDLGNNARATEIYDKLVNRGQGGELARNNLALLIADFEYADKSRLELAYDLTKDFEEKKHPARLDTLGWVQYRMGDIEEAQRLLQKAVDLGLNTPRTHYHLGLTYLALDDRKRAKNSLQKAVASGATYTGLEEARRALATL